MKKKPKILFCIDTLASGGAEKLLIQILKRFNFEDYQVYLFIIHHFGVYFDDIPPQVDWFTKETENGRLSQKYDIEIAFLEGAPTKYIAQRSSGALKIAWVHVDLLSLHWTKCFFQNDEEEATCYALMHKIVFVSNYSLLQFKKLFPQVNSHKDVIYNLIDKKIIIRDAQMFQPSKTKLTLCSVGSLIHHKGFDRLIPVISRLVKEDHLDFHFWIVGTGKQEVLLKQLIDEYNLNDIVFLHGFHKNPYPFINNSDIFVSVSLSEGYSLVVAEALSLGKAILATNVGGPIELLDNGTAGLLVDMDDESVYQGLKKIICSADLREALAKKATVRSEIFDVKKTMDEIYRLFSFEKQVYPHTTTHQHVN